jgi:hypothetical protein
MNELSDLVKLTSYWTSCGFSVAYSFGWMWIDYPINFFFT